MINTKLLNRNQSELRKALKNAASSTDAIQPFLNHHAMLHTAKISENELPSYEDEILNDLSVEAFRRISENCGHSIAWCIWHIARIEDVAMNMVVAGVPQVFNKGGWKDRIGTDFIDTGNHMSEKEILRLSTKVDFYMLREYRAVVGQRTREIVADMNSDQLKEKTRSERLQRVLDEGAVRETARGVIEYWSRRDIAGMLLMPASRHLLVHLNEAAKLKKRR